VLEVIYHHAKFGEARISPATKAAKTVEFLPAAIAALRAAQSAAPVFKLLRSEGNFEDFRP